MKRILLITFFVLLILSCVKSDVNTSVQPSIEVIEYGYPHFIYDSLDTKTNIFVESGHYKTDWTIGDKIGIYFVDKNGKPTGKPVGYSTIINGKAVAETKEHSFDPMGFELGKEYIQIYPYIEDATAEEVYEIVLNNQLQQKNADLTNLGNFSILYGNKFFFAEKGQDIKVFFTYSTAFIRLTMPAHKNAIGVSIRGAWGDRLYNVTFSSPISTETTTYIVVPEVRSYDNLYVSVYDEKNCYCYEKVSLQASISVNSSYYLDLTGKGLYYSAYPCDGIINGYEYVNIAEHRIKTCNEGACVPWQRGVDCSNPFEKSQSDNYNFVDFRNSQFPGYLNIGGGSDQISYDVSTSLGLSPDDKYHAVSGMKLSYGDKWIFLPVSENGDYYHSGYVINDDNYSFMYVNPTTREVDVRFEDENGVSYRYNHKLGNYKDGNHPESTCMRCTL